MTCRAVDIARDWIGTPYRHQASEKGAGADCLGLVRGVWRDMGGQAPVEVPKYTQDWGEAGGDERLWRAARAHLRPRETGDIAPGDILLFRMRSGSVAKHLGIASDRGHFIHAYSRHGVIESALTLSWRRRVVARFAFPDRSI